MSVGLQLRRCYLTVKFSTSEQLEHLRVIYRKNPLFVSSNQVVEPNFDRKSKSLHITPYLQQVIVQTMRYISMRHIFTPFQLGAYEQPIYTD